MDIESLLCIQISATWVIAAMLEKNNIAKTVFYFTAMFWVFYGFFTKG